MHVSRKRNNYRPKKLKSAARKGVRIGLTYFVRAVLGGPGHVNAFDGVGVGRFRIEGKKYREVLS